MPVFVRGAVFFLYTAIAETGKEYCYDNTKEAQHTERNREYIRGGGQRPELSPPDGG